MVSASACAQYQRPVRSERMIPRAPRSDARDEGDEGDVQRDRSIAMAMLVEEALFKRASENSRRKQGGSKATPKGQVSRPDVPLRIRRDANLTGKELPRALVETRRASDVRPWRGRVRAMERTVE